MHLLLLLTAFVILVNAKIKEYCNCNGARLRLTNSNDVCVYFTSLNPNIVRFSIQLEENDNHEYCGDDFTGSSKMVQYITDVKPKNHGLQIRRKSTNELLVNIFDINVKRNGVINDVYFNLRVPTENIYGFGEQFHEELRHDFSKKTRLSFFNHDQGPTPNIPLYGFQPFYMGLDRYNESYGVYYNTTYPMEVNLTRINNQGVLKYHAMGGNIDLYTVIGPKPDQVVQQYTEIIGRPYLPTYWSLGFHLCRYGYKNLTYLKQVWDRNRAAGIPQDVQFIDIDYMNHYKGFTYDQNRFKNLPQFIEDTIHKTGRKLVLIQEPSVKSNLNKPYPPYENGIEMRVFIKNSNNSGYFTGMGWAGKSHWIDYTHPNSTKYWIQMFKDFHKTIAFDGAWLDMNDPSIFVNLCAINDYNDPVNPVLNYQPMSSRTVCLDAIQHAGLHLQWHNYYGHQEIVATDAALNNLFPGKRQFILSRSTSPGSGQYSSHWSGDNSANWKDLRHSIVIMLEFNMFAIPFVGSDICGFGGNTNEELCLRWSQLGAFYPYSRNHNDVGSTLDQDPGVWPRNTSSAIKDALNLRYSLLPYLYTLMFEANLRGSTVARPLFFEFPDDSNTWNEYSQFLWGSNLMIVPILQPYMVSRSAYFPGGNIWYNLNENMSQTNRINKLGNHKTISICKRQIGLYSRGGSIIPWQFPSQTTQESRKNPFGLIASFTPGTGRSDSAWGTLFWDDGDSKYSVANGDYCHFTFSAKQNDSGGSLSIDAGRLGCPVLPPPLAKIIMGGMKGRPISVDINTSRIDDDVMGRIDHDVLYNSTTRMMQITNFEYKFSSGTVLQWRY